MATMAGSLSDNARALLDQTHGGESAPIQERGLGFSPTKRPLDSVWPKVVGGSKLGQGWVNTGVRLRSDSKVGGGATGKFKKVIFILVYY